MEETIRSSKREQCRAFVLTRPMSGGPGVDEATRTRILGLADGAYVGFDDTRLAEVLAEREGITISRPGLRRLLRGTGRKAKRRRRAPRHRSRRDRMEREGLLLQTDGSRHDWLEERGPWLTLVGYIDDASGRVTGAVFRDQEDTAGYLEALGQTLVGHGVPGSIHHDLHTIFEPPLRQPLTLEEQLVDTRVPTQLRRAFAEQRCYSMMSLTRSMQPVHAAGRASKLSSPSRREPVTLASSLVPETVLESSRISPMYTRNYFQSATYGSSVGMSGSTQSGKPHGLMSVPGPSLVGP